MAEHYVSEIEKVNPRGPYLLGGGSMGGAVALQMAQLLKKKGKEILLIGMFDTISPLAHYQNPKKRILAKIKAFMASDQKVQTLLNRLFIRIAEPLKDIIFNMICNTYRKLRRPIPQMIRYWYIRRVNLDIMRNYSPTPYPGRITHFRSTHATNLDPYHGWGKIALEGLDIIEISARHRKFIESAELGKELSSLLENLQQQYRDSLDARY